MVRGWSGSSGRSTIDVFPSGWFVVRILLTEALPALRRLKRQPRTPLAVVAILGLGIGAATAVFAVVDSILLRPLPWPSADRLVLVHATLPDQRDRPSLHGTWNRAPIAWAAWKDMQSSPVFEDVGVWYGARMVFEAAEPELVPVQYVSASLLGLLGARPAIGRLFTPLEDYEEVHLAVLTHDTWRRRFGGRDTVIGETVLLRSGTSAGAASTVIGVLAPDVRFPGEQPEFLLPIGLMSWNGRFEQNRFLRVMARLAVGIHPNTALQAVEPFVRGSVSQGRRSAAIVTIAEAELGAFRPTLWLLLGGSGLLLFIACGSVAGVLFGNVRARRHEIGVCFALGCSRGRLFVQLAIEHVLLAMLVGVVGLLSAFWFTPALLALAPGELRDWTAVQIDARVVLLSLSLGLVTVLGSGLLPAFVLSATNPNVELADRRGREARWHQLTSRAVLSGQIALTLVLVVSASLLAETLLRLQRQPLGFEPAGVAVVSVRPTRDASLSYRPSAPLPGDMRPGANSRQAYLTSLFASWMYTAGLLEALDALPGVVSTAGAGRPPFFQSGLEAPVHRRDQSLDVEIATVNHVTEGYLETLRVPLRRGRSFERPDRGRRRIIVSEELERRLFQDRSVGETVILNKNPYEIIGVAGNVTPRYKINGPAPTVYVLDETFMQIGHYLVRFSGEPGATLPLLRQTITQHDPSMVVTSTTTLEGVIAQATAPERFRASLSILVGIAGLGLAMGGVYAMGRRWVAERRKEIAVRVVCGARPRNVAALVLRETAVTVGVGVAVGLPIALLTSHLLASFLFGVTPTSMSAFAVALVGLAATACIATLPSGLPASRIDVRSNLS